MFCILENNSIIIKTLIISLLQIWVKKTSDNSKFRINLSYLSKGKMSIKRRAAV